MFPTSVKSECRTRPATTASIPRRQTLQLTDAYPASQEKVRILKQKLKNLEEEYRHSLTNVNKIKTSIEKTNKQACMTRMSFMKMYESKKVRLEDYHLAEELKVSKTQNSRHRCRKARERKINSELHHFIVKSEQDQMKEDLRKKNKTEKLLRKQKVLEKQKESETEAKCQFERVKDGELYLRARKRKIAEMQSLKARQNYMGKLGEEMALISSYNNILQKVENWGELDYMEDAQKGSEKSKSFFLTRTSD